jgi:hypothetical protein
MSSRLAIKPIVLFALLAAATASLAQPADEELARIEQNYREKREAIIRPLIDAYAEKLKLVQDGLTRRGDFSRAQAVQNERARVLAVPAEASATAADSQGKPPASPNDNTDSPPVRGPVTLTGDKVTVSGGANFAESPAAVRDLSKKGAAAQWKVPRLLLERYRVVIHYACPPLQGGHYQLTVGSLPPRSFTVAPTGAGGPPIEVDLGEYEFSSSPPTVRVEVVDLLPKASYLCTLYGISFRPVAGANGSETGE